jgi:[acyl-carrier-protein] S-malonyltransferase
VQHMSIDGVETFVEVGAGTVLTGLVKRIAPNARLINVGDAAGVVAYTKGS